MFSHVSPSPVTSLLEMLDLVYRICTRDNAVYFHYGGFRQCSVVFLLSISFLTLTEYERRVAKTIQLNVVVYV